MPEMTFSLKWPDGATQECYSPSLVMHDYLNVETSYDIDDFMERTATALQLAAERVKARYGFYCTSATAQLDQLRTRRADYADGSVTVLTMTPGREALA